MEDTISSNPRLDRLNKVMGKMMEQIKKEIRIDSFKEAYPEYSEVGGRSIENVREQLLSQLCDNILAEFGTLCQDFSLSEKFSLLDKAIEDQSKEVPETNEVTPEEEIRAIILEQKKNQLDLLQQHETSLEKEFEVLEKNKEDLLLKGKQLYEEISKVSLQNSEVLKTVNPV
mmetsp:Transcript_8406/g.9596  ORF Transcript_8406/g.9596 Transcript_8406/m.9596 type:complete len:172 (+) Transcript_8406:199-714(+)